MKKQNRNVCAYIRQPNVQPNEQLLTALKSNRQSGNTNMFNQIVGQMDQQLTSYLSKLVTKNQRQQQKKKSTQKPSNHQRTKSYADILVETPSSSKTPVQKGHSHRGSHPSAQINNLFFSLNSTPTNQKPSHNFSDNKLEERGERVGGNCSFLETLDTYITDLSFNKSIKTKKTEINIDQNTIDQRNNQKNRQNNLTQLKFLQRLQACSKRQKQLKIANRILQSQNLKLKNKLKKNKILVKTTMQELYQYAQSLSQQLKQQKRQRRKLQQFMSQFQEKITMLRPQRKTLGARQRLQDYLFVSASQTTEQQPQPEPQQSDLPLHSHLHECPSIRSKSMRRRKPMPRSTAKQSRVSGIVMEDFSAMLAARNFQFGDQDEELTDPYEA